MPVLIRRNVSSWPKILHRAVFSSVSAKAVGHMLPSSRFGMIGTVELSSGFSALSVTLSLAALLGGSDRGGPYGVHAITLPIGYIDPLAGMDAPAIRRVIRES